jgi:hypothetical protein
MVRVYYDLFKGPPNWKDFYETPYPIFYKLIKDKLEAEKKHLEQLEKQRQQMKRRG